MKKITSLESVTIPSGVTSIGDAVFIHSSNLTSITVKAKTPPTFGDRAFGFNGPFAVFPTAVGLRCRREIYSATCMRRCNGNCN